VVSRNLGRSDRQEYVYCFRFRTTQQHIFMSIARLKSVTILLRPMEWTLLDILTPLGLKRSEMGVTGDSINTVSGL
jgi:hypothetical protein